MVIKTAAAALSLFGRSAGSGAVEQPAKVAERPAPNITYHFFLLPSLFIFFVLHPRDGIEYCIELPAQVPRARNY